LNHIINHLELALDGSLDYLAQGHVQSSLKASKSLIYAINDLLDLTKVENSAILMHEESFSLQGMILEVLGAFAVEAERKGLRIILNMDTTRLPEIIIGDSQRLRQVVSNILSNSLKSSSHGTISVDIYSFTSSATKSMLNITVKDEGKGMSEKQLDKIFQQFEDILDEDEPTDDEHSEIPALASIGLGLAMVARFVSSRGGQIRIETKESAGTRVSLELPLRTSTKTPPKQPLLTPSSESGNEVGDVKLQGMTTSGLPPSCNGPVQPFPGEMSPGDINPFSNPCASSPMEHESYPFPETSPTDKIRLRILAAEDNPLNAKVLKMQLKRMGHDVTLVGDGQACLDKFKENSNYFDIILMDFQVRLLPHSFGAR
jgi:Histidine kinase-, DNA gyrase B-, and HSP90-like ATPase